MKFAMEEVNGIEFTVKSANEIKSVKYSPQWAATEVSNAIKYALQDWNWQIPQW